MRCFWLLLILTVVLNGCGFTNGKTAASKSQGYQVVDDCGYTLSFTEKPQRIYAATSSLEEVIIDLVPANRIVAISAMATDERLSLIADKAMRITPKIQGKIGVEGVLALNPDLVIMQDNMDVSLINSLRDSGLKVLVTKVPVTVEMIKARIDKISIAVGEEKKGKEILSTLNKKLDYVASKVGSLPDSEKKIIMAYSQQGVFGSAKGLFNDICNKSFVLNGAAMAGLVRGEHLSKEKIIEYDPDVFIFPSYDTGKYGDLDVFIQEVLNDPALKNIKAIKNNNILIVKDKYRSTTSHYVGDAVMDISKKVYPQYF